MLGPKILPSGNVVDALNLQLTDINAWDIAWGLAHINRYNGATCVPHSVLTHTALCYTLAMAQRPDTNLSTQLAVLLHDAAETYLFDMPHHVKKMACMAEFRELDKTITALIYGRFGVVEEDVDYALVALADKQACDVELRHFWPHFDPASTGNDCPPPIAVKMPRAAKPIEFIQVLKQLAGTQAPSEAFFLDPFLAPYAVPNLAPVEDFEDPGQADGEVQLEPDNYDPSAGRKVVADDFLVAPVRIQSPKRAASGDTDFLNSQVGRR